MIIISSDSCANIKISPTLPENDGGFVFDAVLVFDGRGGRKGVAVAARALVLDGGQARRVPQIVLH